MSEKEKKSLNQSLKPFRICLNLTKDISLELARQLPNTKTMEKKKKLRKRLRKEKEENHRRFSLSS